MRMTPRSSSSHSWAPAAAAAGWLGPWLGVAALALWSSWPGTAALLAATAGLLAGVFWGERRTTVGALGAVVLLAGIVAGFSAHRQVARVSGDWDAYWQAREEVVGERLNAELEERLQAAEAAADALALEVEQGEGDLAQAVERIRRRYGVTALALYGAGGELRAWGGAHRGRVPEEVQRGLRRYVYGNLPLFGYLYVTSPAGPDGYTMASILLRSDLPEPLATDAGDFATRFREEVGERVRLTGGDREVGGAGWDLTLGEEVLFSVVLDPPAPEVRAAEVFDRWRLIVGGLALLAWILMAAGGQPRLATGAVAGLELMFLAAALPFAGVPALAPVFDRSLYTLPGPLPLSLGRLLALALAAVTVVAVLPRPRRRIPPPVAGALAAVFLPLVLAWLGSGARPGALAEGGGTWLAYQATVGIILTLLTGTLLVLAPADAERRLRGLVAIVLGALLGIGSAAFVWMSGALPIWWVALWGVPVALGAASMEARPGWQPSLAAWLLAGMVALTAAVPSAWADRVEARRAVAVAYLERLAAPEDPMLERALLRLGRSADSLSRAGERGVDLLYGAWRASRLAELGEPAWLTLWTPAGIPQEELRVGVADRPDVAFEVQDDPGPAPGMRVLRYNRHDARYVLRVTLPTGDILTAAAPPFPDPRARAPTSPLLAGGAALEPHPLTLIPVEEGGEEGPAELRWVRTPEGWQAERRLRFSNGVVYHAQYAVPLPGLLLATARATLLLVIDLLLFLALRAAGRGFLRDALPKDLRWSRLMISFRARVTLALFGFFVLANAIFGTLAYRSIAGASHRAAEVLAERVAEDASGWYFEMGGRMQALARRAGVELLEYREGELREGSVEELVELGLYHGWIPMPVYRQLEGREAVRSTVEGRLGGWQYVTAYRRLPDDDILAAKVPLQAGASAIRAADVAELLAFAVVVGAALSLGLALLVGRALTRPIQALQIASERVGAGNLGLRLPAQRSDEFGAVFRAFNRMVGRLRRARRQLVRTTRRTQAIMEEAAVGMVAVDPAGRVTLVNPRAEDLLEAEVVAGSALPVRGVLGEELSAWLAAFMAGDRDEADGELHAGTRRFRVRARRLGTSGARGGAVLALEDVTDELRTERVLAWGEMARQVAHEVKNPLTPIKLSVQHIRRAWEDGRPDFPEILRRNADAMLIEIDRLAAIAQSFSRFGAPTGSTEVPLEAVDVGGVVDEVLALYEGSEGPIRFERRVEAALPAARARVPELKEVLVNLLENARAACAAGGVVRVEVARDPDGLVSIRVVDDGSGIQEALLGRVFEPHFSTRSTGTGLGLAIVRRLVESWGGQVSLESEVGVGTSVIVRVPTWS